MRERQTTRGSPPGWMAAVPAMGGHGGSPAVARVPAAPRTGQPRQEVSESHQTPPAEFCPLPDCQLWSPDTHRSLLVVLHLYTVYTASCRW